jgi:hypothetical protein
MAGCPVRGAAEEPETGQGRIGVIRAPPASLRRKQFCQSLVAECGALVEGWHVWTCATVAAIGTTGAQTRYTRQ